MLPVYISWGIVSIMAIGTVLHLKKFLHDKRQFTVSGPGGVKLGDLDPKGSVSSTLDPNGGYVISGQKPAKITVESQVYRVLMGDELPGIYGFEEPLEQKKQDIQGKPAAPKIKYQS